MRLSTSEIIKNNPAMIIVIRAGDLNRDFALRELFTSLFVLIDII